VGVILYEMITQKPPFEGEPLEVIAHQIGHEAPPLSKKASPETKLTPELEALVASLLHRDREQRPADVTTATAMIEGAERSLRELHEAQAPAVVIDARPSQRPSFVDRLKQRDRRALALVSGALMLLIAIPLILLLGRSAPPVEDEEASRPKKKHHEAAEASAAAASTSASAASSTTSSAASTAKKPTTSTKSNEKGFGKLKSLFK
jgi:serine/threonine protein kinase